MCVGYLPIGGSLELLLVLQEMCVKFVGGFPVQHKLNG